MWQENIKKLALDRDKIYQRAKRLDYRYRVFWTMAGGKSMSTPGRNTRDDKETSSSDRININDTNIETPPPMTQI